MLSTSSEQLPHITREATLPRVATRVWLFKLQWTVWARAVQRIQVKSALWLLRRRRGSTTVAIAVVFAAAVLEDASVLAARADRITILAVRFRAVRANGITSCAARDHTVSVHLTATMR